MLGGLAAAVAGLAWLTGTMPSGLGLASLMPSSASAPGTGSMPTASSPALAMDSQPDTPAASVAAASAVPSAGVAATTPAPRGAVPLPPMSPEAQLAAAPAAAWPVPAPASAGVASAVVARPPVQVAARNQSQLQAQGGLDLRLRKALDGEGITSIVEVDPTSGHVLVADPQADHVLRERTDMLIRAVYAGASLPEPQIEHRWMSPMHGERADPLQAQAAAPTVQGKGQARTTTKSRTQAPAPGTTQRDLASTRTPGMVASERVNLAPPGAGGPTRHVESARAGATAADAEELRPVVPSGRVTASCMEDIAAKTSNRRGALSACMKRSCCSSSGNLNSEECRAYQKAYPYTCGAG
jgi:hypothetical protein